MTRSAATYDEAGSGTTRRGRSRPMATAWAVSALAARRAAALGPPPGVLPLPLHRGLLRASVWMETLAGFACVHRERVAVISVVPPHRRDQRRFFLVILAHDVPVAAALAVALAWWWPAAVAGLAAMGLVMVAVAAGERRPGPFRARMAAVTPSGAYHVRNFFADEAHKGAGRTVLDAACRQADEAGHVLYLDTVAERLVDYYAEFGFEVRATEALTHGATLLCRRMVREPDAAAAGVAAHAAHSANARPPIAPAPFAAGRLQRQPARGEVEEW